MRALAGFCCALALATGCACADEPIAIAHGFYRAVLPKDWDGKTPRPLVLYLHGYGQSSGDITGDFGLTQAATGLGAVLAVPDGINHAWSHVGAPRHERDDLAFLHEVVADAERRWPIDARKVYAAGFSIGGSMVWDLACHAPQGFAAFLPVSGAFWLPYPERCEGPVTLRHVHGLTDTTVPMTGRTLFGKFTQGDVRQGWNILLATDKCPAAPIASAREEDLSCQEWPCAHDHVLELCLHGDGHDMEPRYLESGLAWAFGRGS